MQSRPDTAMPHPDACFDADWLALRAAADRAARAPRLETLAAAWLRGRQQQNPQAPLRLVNLAAAAVPTRATWRHACPVRSSGRCSTTTPVFCGAPAPSARTCATPGA